MLGTDLTNLDGTDLGLLTNDEVLAVDQRGHPGHPVDRTTPAAGLVPPANGDGSYTVALFNLGGSAATVTANWTDLGFGGTAAVRDLWSHTDLGTVDRHVLAHAAAHASRLLRVMPAGGFHYTAMHYGIVNASTASSGRDRSSTADGAPWCRRPATRAADQQWQLVPTGDGYSRWSTRSSGSLLNIPTGHDRGGTQLIQ